MYRRFNFRLTWMETMKKPGWFESWTVYKKMDIKRPACGSIAPLCYRLSLIPVSVPEFSLSWGKNMIKDYFHFKSERKKSARGAVDEIGFSRAHKKKCAHASMMAITISGTPGILGISPRWIFRSLPDRFTTAQAPIPGASGGSWEPLATSTV